MSLTAYKLPGTGANRDNGNAAAWTDPSRVTVDDGSESGATIVDATGTQLLAATNFGWTTLDVPSGNIVTAINIKVRVRVSAPFICGVGLVSDAHPLGFAPGAIEQSVTSAVSIQYTFAQSMALWGIPSDIYDSDWGCCFYAVGDILTVGQGLAVDDIQMQIEHRPRVGSQCVVIL